ncbi:MAG: hypothetical protein N2450_07815 [bacterium]|nr:hypothetical protein [bacterium]
MALSNPIRLLDPWIHWFPKDYGVKDKPPRLLTNGTSSQLHLTTQLIDLYRKGALGQTNSSYQWNQRLQWDTPIKKPIPIQFQLILIRNQTVIQHQLMQNQGELETSEEKGGLGFTYHAPIQWSIHINTHFSKGKSPAYGLCSQWSFWKKGNLSAWYGTQTDRTQFSGSIRNNPLILEWRSAQEYHGFQTQIALPTEQSEWVFTYDKTIPFLRHDNPKSPTIVPFGYEQKLEGAFFQRFQHGEASIRGMQKIGRLQSYGYQGEMDFAKFTRLTTEHTQIAFSAILTIWERRPIGVEIAHSRWRGYIRGHLDFWPFTSGLIELLGNRRYFLGELTTRLNEVKLHFGSLSPSPSRPVKAFYVECLGLDLSPSLKFNHWRPQYLIFGKADEQIYFWNVQRWQGIQLKVQQSVPLRQFQVNGSVSQIVPLRVQTKSTPSTSLPTQPQPSKQARGYGGGAIRLDLIYFFE